MPEIRPSASFRSYRTHDPAITGTVPWCGGSCDPASYSVSGTRSRDHPWSTGVRTRHASSAPSARIDRAPGSGEPRAGEGAQSMTIATPPILTVEETKAPSRPGGAHSRATRGAREQPQPWTEGGVGDVGADTTNRAVGKRRWRGSATFSPSSDRPGICSPGAAPACAREQETQEVPANADVAQLVEHFTRNEGVRGSSPRVGSAARPATCASGCHGDGRS